MREVGYLFRTKTDLHPREDGSSGRSTERVWPFLLAPELPNCPRIRDLSTFSPIPYLPLTPWAPQRLFSHQCLSLPSLSSGATRVPSTLPVLLLHLLFLLYASHHPIPVIYISQDAGASHQSDSLRFPRHLLKGGRYDVGQGVTHFKGDAGGQIGHPRPSPMALDALDGEWTQCSVQLPKYFYYHWIP